MIETSQVIHPFPEGFIIEEPSAFTDPFRYSPHPAVQMAARLITAHIDADPTLSEAFSEGKMLGVLVCRDCFIAAFSGNVGGRSTIAGFVPPIYDLTAPDGEFKRREAEISELNRQIGELLDSDRLTCLKRELADAEYGRDMELNAIKEMMAIAKRRRKEVRSQCSDPDILAGLIRESQHEKAEFRRTRQALDTAVAQVCERLDKYNATLEGLKKQRASMSENLQDWIFRQYIIHNSLGETSSIADVFAAAGLIPPGGTGECAAPKLLEYAYRNHLKPLAMGEFWYGKSSKTAVRSHGRFYPSCTSKCGPLLGYMMKGLHFTTSSNPDFSQQSDGKTESPITIYEDNAIIVVEKPSGMPSVPGLDGRIPVEGYLQGGTHSVHRLDMDTSGVMIFAKTPQAAVILRRQFEDHTILKTYMARVSCDLTLSIKEGTQKENISLPLSPDYDERPRQKVDFMQGKPAYTEYKVASLNSDGTADLLLYPHTGRTHQLRVHCAHALGLNSPIIGDMLYGGHSVSNRTFQAASRLCLHALSITFRHPITDQVLTFTSKHFLY